MLDFLGSVFWVKFDVLLKNRKSIYNRPYFINLYIQLTTTILMILPDQSTLLVWFRFDERTTNE
jgi:hypothetical protein